MDIKQVYLPVTSSFVNRFTDVVDASYLNAACVYNLCHHKEQRVVVVLDP